MASKLSISNMALQTLGEEPIASFEERTKKVVMVETFYDESLDELLARTDWGFAHRRVILPSEIAVPEFGFSAQFPLPSDFIRAVRLNDNKDAVYRIELGRILMNADTINLLYVCRVSDTLLFPPQFAVALSGLMAYRMAYGLAGNTKASELMAVYEMAFSRALIADRESALGVVEKEESGEGIGAWRNREG